MNCAKCGKKMSVVDSRCVGVKTYRKYKCSCGEKMFTEEKRKDEANRCIYLATKKYYKKGEE